MKDRRTLLSVPGRGSTATLQVLRDLKALQVKILRAP